MNEIIILHLSDLHITGKQKTVPKILNSLLNDIEKQIIHLAANKIVVVITGDIIDKGNKKALDSAKMFFDKLYDKLGEKILALYIVPGNHDKKRTDINKILVPAYRKLITDRKFCNNNTGNAFGDTFQENLWPIQIATYNESGYIDLIKYVYKKFDMQEIGNIAQKTFGVHVLNISGRKYCFVMLNTAWCCIDEEDNRQIILGKFQLDVISQQFHELTDEEDIDMTFVLGHHPIECLCGIEQDALFSNMISFTEMSANAYLCGHIHDRSIINWSNNHHAIHTLVTGFGWPDQPGGERHDHYYSIYCFNLNLNSMDIYVRKTDDGSNFIPDLSIYTGSHDRYDEGYDKLVRPIRFREAQGEIVLSVAKDVPPKSFYASKDFLNYSRLFIENICKLFFDEKNIIEKDKEDLYEAVITENYEEIDDPSFDEKFNALESFLDNPEMFSENKVHKMDWPRQVLYEKRKLIFEHFLGFIQWLCQRIHEAVVLDIDNEEKIIRSHFRYLSDKTTKNYQVLCSSFSIGSKENIDTNQPSDIKYGDLIEAAFSDSKHGCMIYSVNEKKCTRRLNDKWSDFITVIPKFEANKYKKRVNKKAEKMYPLITFGITIEDSKDEKILQCLDFYSFDRIVADLLRNYTDTFDIDINEFVIWLNQDKKMEESENARSN